MKRLKKIKYVIGIDEAGRGPLAGPVTVGAFGAESKMGKWFFRNLFQNKLRDSKKLSPKQRYTIYRKILDLKKESRIFFAVSHVSNKIIDKRGINFAIQKAINNIFLKLLQYNGRESAVKMEVRLDGLLKVPKEFEKQKTIIKGDEKDIFIACASIVAKVRRDRLMQKMAKKFPLYNFHLHKGYGTLLHRKLLKKHGLSPLHRKTYSKKLINLLI